MASFSLAPPVSPVIARVQRATNLVTLATPLIGLCAGVGFALSGIRRGDRLGRRDRSLGLGLTALSFGFALARWQLQRFVTEATPYRVVGAVNGLELREYPRRVLAKTVVDSPSWDEALEEGFRRLAGYIFGGNARHERLSMTTPVTTSLPEQKSSLPHTMAFAMPGDRTLASLPPPEDARIRLLEGPAQVVAVLTFRGAYGGDLPARKREELLARVYRAGLTPHGDVVFSGYDPPSTLGILRRNEVSVPVQL